METALGKGSVGTTYRLSPRWRQGGHPDPAHLSHSEPVSIGSARQADIPAQASLPSSGLLSHTMMETGKT